MTNSKLSVTEEALKEILAKLIYLSVLWSLILSECLSELINCCFFFKACFYLFDEVLDTLLFFHLWRDLGLLTNVFVLFVIIIFVGSLFSFSLLTKFFIFSLLKRHFTNHINILLRLDVTPVLISVLRLGIKVSLLSFVALSDWEEILIYALSTLFLNVFHRLLGVSLGQILVILRHFLQKI